MLFSVHWCLLEGGKFFGTGDSLANVLSIHVAPIAEVTEAEVKVITIEADPVSDSLSQDTLRSLLLCLLLRNGRLWLEIGTSLGESAQIRTVILSVYLIALLGD